MTIYGVFELFGGIAIFLSALKMLSKNFSAVLGGRLKRYVYTATESKYLGVLSGAFVTALMQSSVAVNVLAVSLVESSAITLTGACAVIIGTNIGTTVTAQIVSLSLGGGAINASAIGAFVAFLGFLLGEISSGKFKQKGDLIFGFGIIFVGIKLMTTAVETFYDKPWFINFFLVKSPPISLLNGFFITAVCQSSSVVTTMLVILTEGGILNLDGAVYMILGANIGSCTAVIFASDSLSVQAKRAAWFNLLFNAAWAIIFFFIMLVCGKNVTDFLLRFSRSKSGAVANFHTLFNVVFGVLTIPFLPVIEKGLMFLYKEKPKNGVIHSRKKRGAEI